MLRRIENQTDATPRLRPLPEALPEAAAPTERNAVYREPVAPLQRRGVRVALLLAALLAVGAVTLPITTGMSAGEWLRTGNLRAAYGADNLRYTQASALIQLHLLGPALDVVEALPAQDPNRETLLAELFPQALASTDPHLAVRAILTSAPTQNQTRCVELAAHLQAVGGSEDALRRLSAPAYAPVRDRALSHLATVLSPEEMGLSERLLSALAPGALYNETRDTLVSRLLLEGRSAQALALVRTARLPAERWPLLRTLCTSARTRDILPDALAAFDEARTIAPPKDRAALAAMAEYLASLCQERGDTKNARRLRATLR